MLAALLAITLAVLVAATRLTAHPAPASALTWNAVSKEARLSQQVATADCTALSRLHLANVPVALAQENTSGSFTIPPGQPAAGMVLAGLPVFCDVRLRQDNPPAAGQAHVEIWLPLVAWNGRFRGVGGGGNSCGISYSALAQALQSGYATASTDCGRPVSRDNRAVPRKPDYRLNRPLTAGFASRDIREMTVDGKVVTTAFYGTGPSYS